jgi:arabinogalactan endo-1,4-beta-galactosidase
MKSFTKTTLIILMAYVLHFNPINAQPYAIGADLSFLKAAEDGGTSFKENGKVKQGLQIFKDHGYNWIRLRLFHSPTELPNNLTYTIALAREAKDMGFKFLLDFHYSDTWADPGKQYIPKAWENLDHAILVDSVYEYTHRTMEAFRNAGAYPDMVQPGNEIIHGMLWPNGHIPDSWDQFIELLQAGINGVLAENGERPAPGIMIHIDQGGNKEKTRYFFDKIFEYGIDFDVIGQSYYPWWHGSLLDLRENLHFMATAYKKPIVLVEVAYCSKPTEYIEKPAPYPETPEGQKEFLESVHEMVLHTPDNLGIGIFWWEPATFGGHSHRDYFDDEGNVLPVINVFDKYSRY